MVYLWYSGSYRRSGLVATSPAFRLSPLGRWIAKGLVRLGLGLLGLLMRLLLWILERRFWKTVGRMERMDFILQRLPNFFGFCFSVGKLCHASLKVGEWDSLGTWEMGCFLQEDFLAFAPRLNKCCKNRRFYQTCETPRNRGTFQNPAGFLLISGSMAILMGLYSLNHSIFWQLFYNSHLFGWFHRACYITPISNWYFLILQL